MPPRHEVLQELDNIAKQVEEGVLADLAKLGRLMRLETVHNGKNNCEMLGMVANLLGLLDTECSTEQDGDDGIESSMAGSCSEREDFTEDSDAVENEDTNPDATDADATDADATDADATDADATDAEEEEEDSGPIMPAFTSTSINLSSNNSRSSESGEPDYDAPSIEPYPAETELLTESAGLPKATGEPKVPKPSRREAKVCVGKVPKEESRGGKKQVSFVEEGESCPCTKPQRPQQTSVTIYARMSPSDVGELVSSSLISDIMSYVNPNSNTCCALDKCCVSDSTVEQPVVAMNYVSVTTTENSNTKLLPSLGSRSGTTKVLSFTINGEILLSTPPDESTSSCCAADTIEAEGANRYARPTTARNRQKEALVRQQSLAKQEDSAESEEEPSVTEEESDASQTFDSDCKGYEACDASGECWCTGQFNVSEKNSDISDMTHETQESGGDTPAEPGSDPSCAKTPWEGDTTPGELAKSDSDLTDTNEASEGEPAEKAGGGVNQEEPANEDSGDTGELKVDPELESSVISTELGPEGCQGGTTTCDVGSCAEDCTTDSECGSRTTGVTALAAQGETSVTFDSDKTRVVVESNGLRLEFDIVAMCSAMCKAIQQHLGPQLAINGAPLSLEQAVVLPTDSENSGTSDDSNTGQTLGDSGGPTNSEGEASSSDAPTEEKPPSPYDCSMATPSSFGISPELMREMMKRPYDVRCEDPDWTPPTATPTTAPNQETTGTSSELRTSEKADEPPVVSSSVPSTPEVTGSSNDSGGENADLDIGDITEKGANTTSSADVASVGDFGSPGGVTCATSEGGNVTTANNDPPDLTPETVSSESGSPTEGEEAVVENTQAAVVPYDSQIVTIKVRKALAEQTSPDNGATQVEGAAEPLEAARSGETPPIIETAPDSEQDGDGGSPPEAGTDNGSIPEVPADKAVVDSASGTIPEGPTDQVVAVSGSGTIPEGPTDQVVAVSGSGTIPEGPTDQVVAVSGSGTIPEGPTDQIVADSGSGTSSPAVEGKLSLPQTETEPPVAAGEGQTASLGGKTESLAEQEVGGSGSSDGVDSAEAERKGETEAEEPLSQAMGSGSIAAPGGQSVDSGEQVMTATPDNTPEPTAAHDPTMEQETASTQDAAETTVSIGCGGFQRDHSKDGEESSTFLSKIRKSLASFRRSDLEEAVGAPDKQSADEKLKLRQTKSRPISIPIEPPREPLLPRRAKMNRMYYQTPVKPQSSRGGPVKSSGPLKANSRVAVQRDSRTSVKREEVAVKEPGSGVKNSKSFRSQSSLTSADAPQIYTKPRTSSQPGRTEQASKQLKTVDSDSVVATEPTAKATEPVTSEHLYKPRSLPASIHQYQYQSGEGQAGDRQWDDRHSGERRSRKMRKSRSERVSTVPKLPKL